MQIVYIITPNQGIRKKFLVNLDKPDAAIEQVYRVNAQEAKRGEPVILPDETLRSEPIEFNQLGVVEV